MPAEIAGARSAEQSPFAHRAEQSPFAHFANTTINSLVSYLRGAVKIYTYHQSILKRLQEVIMKKSAKLLSAVMAGNTLTGVNRTSLLGTLSVVSSGRIVCNAVSAAFHQPAAL